MFRIVYANALRKTEKSTYQALEGFVHDINSICEARPITINLGTDTSKEGRMITKNILKTICKGIGENKKPINPKVVFKIKEGINLKETDPNYDLLKEACEVALQTKNISISKSIEDILSISLSIPFNAINLSKSVYSSMS